jgi:hypothetical protein
MDRISYLWKSFEDAFLARGSCDEQRRDMRIAFFSGALALNAVSRSLSGLPTDEQRIALSEVSRELEEFRLDLLTKAVLDSMRYSAEELHAIRQKG